jgi:hypothetical protein
MRDMSSDDVRAWAEAIAKPFVPDAGLSGGNYADGELTRIANAAEYAAAQLYEIRQLLEKIAAK